VLTALKSQEVINLEEIMLLSAVQDLKTSAKEIYELATLVISSEMAVFKKELAKYSKLLQENKVSQESLIEKKRFI